MKAGFTLIEVMIAMIILAYAVTSISNLQYRALFRVQRNDNSIAKIFLLKQHLLSFVMSEKNCKKLSLERPLTTKDEDNATKLVTQISEISPKSSLAPFKKFAYIIKSDLSWPYDGATRQESMVSFIGIPPKKEKAV